MTWVRIHEGSSRHRKIVALSDSAHRLWVNGLEYCQEHLTDGFIPDAVVWLLHRRAKRLVKELLTPAGPDVAPLWDVVPGGYQVHDYLQWNDPRAKIMADRDWKRRRNELYADVELLRAIRARDGQICRYCGKTVNWKDRRGPNSGTYDHVIPRGPNTLDNVVVACRGCNSSKGDKTLDACGMKLISPESKSEASLEPSLKLADISTLTSVLEKHREIPARQKGHRGLAFCGSRIEVPRFLDDEFNKALGTKQPDFDLSGWYVRVDEELEKSGAPHGGIDWLRQRFYADAKLVDRRTSGDRRVDADLRARAVQIRKGIGRCTHEPTCASYDACIGEIIAALRERQEQSA